MVIRCNAIEIDRPNRTIRHRGREYRFMRNYRGETSHLFELTVHLVVGGGLSREQLFWMIYGNDRNGGPDTGPKVIQIKLAVLTPMMFEKLDLRLNSIKIAGVRFYEFVPNFQVPGLFRCPLPMTNTAA